MPSLLALAEQSNESRVIAAFDARMDEAYLAAYARNGDDWDEVIAPRLADRAALPPLPGRALGRDRQRLRSPFDGCATHYRDSIEMRIEGDLPRAGAVARIAARRFARGGGRRRRARPRPYTCATRWPSRPRKGRAER